MNRPRKPDPVPGWHVDDEPDSSLLNEGGHESSGSDFRDQADFSDASRGERIQKVLAAAGVGSRRTCEQLIGGGEVTVNGHVVTDLPAWVDPIKDVIAVRGRKIKPPEPNVYIMLFKPRGCVCTNDDPEGRPRAIDLVKHPSRARLYSVGRLDLDSSGLLLLTNDGELANRLTHPRYDVHKVYEVTVEGAIDDKEMKRLERGLYLTGSRKRGRKGPPRSARRTSRSKIEIVKRDRDRTRLRMELREGRNRQIRRMMAQLGHPVKKLRRIRMGPLKLTDLKAGQWRELTPKELIALRKAAYAGSKFGRQKRKTGSRG